MRYKGLFAALLAVLIPLSLQSCGRIIIEDISSAGADTAEITETDEPYVTVEFTSAEFDKYGGDVGKKQAQKYLDELGNTDCGGATLIIATQSKSSISPDDGATELSRLIIERNAEVERLLNVRLITAEVDHATAAKELKLSSLAGTGRYDILMLPLNEVGRFAVDGSLLDISRDLTLDLGKRYFNASSLEAASFGDAVYAVAGHGSIMPTSYPAIFVNKGILRDAGIDPEKLYSSALRGEWTWDDFLMYTEAIGGLEMFNTVTSQSVAEHFADSVFAASGNSYLGRNEKGETVVGYDPDSAADAVARISAVMSDPTVIISSDKSTIGDFAAGRTAFAFEHLYVMSWLINSDADWGLLPMPKSTEKGDYRSLITDDALMFAIPTVCRDTDAAAMTVAAINAATEGYVYEPFVKYSMEHLLRDNGSVNMLDLILDSAVFDRAVTYGEKFPSLAAITGLVRNSAGNEDWAKTYKTMAKEANKILKDELPIYIVEDEPEETEAPETDPPETKPVETTPPETKPTETKETEQIIK